MAFNVREQVEMYKYTTLKVGGKARYFVEAESEAEVEMAGRFAEQTALPFLVLGGGSNLLISDVGYDGLVIYNQIKGLDYIEGNDDSILLVAKAGEVLDEVIADTVSRGYWGLENLSSIPGTVGAVPVQNVGAYGVEVADLIEWVEVYNVATKNFLKLKKSECHFSYRDSFFKTEVGRQHVIVSVCFKLSKKSQPKISYADLKNYFLQNESPSLNEVRSAVQNIRAGKFPDWQKVGTAGSFFKNPLITKEESVNLLKLYPDLPTYIQEDGLVKISLGYILDKICGLKGYQVGEVCLYSKQALVLVNHGEKNSDEVKKFSDLIIKKVFEKTGVNIMPEVYFVN